jgi:hypothetical protein
MLLKGGRIGDGDAAAADDDDDDVVLSFEGAAFFAAFDLFFSLRAICARAVETSVSELSSSGHAGRSVSARGGTGLVVAEEEEEEVLFFLLPREFKSGFRYEYVQRVNKLLSFS